MTPTLRSANDARFVRLPPVSDVKSGVTMYRWLCEDAAKCNYQWHMVVSEVLE